MPPIPIPLQDAEEILAQVASAHHLIAKSFRSGRLNDPNDLTSWGALLSLLSLLERGAFAAIAQRLQALQNVTPLTFSPVNRDTVSDIEANPHFAKLKETFAALERQAGWPDAHGEL